MKPPEGPFTLGEWLVQPQLNLLSRAGSFEVQLEPKMMDVLVYLARTPGDVVSRETLIDAVWPDLFISESVLTRAIAGLRRALGDDARRPRYIETIAKRGYRLIGGATSSSAPPAATPGGVLPGGSYVVGQWVRAEGFYGRETQLAEVFGQPPKRFLDRGHAAPRQDLTLQAAGTPGDVPTGPPAGAGVLGPSRG